MKILKIIFLLGANLASAQVADEEIGLNQYRKALHLGIGYSGGAGTEDFTIVQQRNTHTVYTFNNGSWGKGIYLKIGYSYKIHPNLGLGMEGGGFIGLHSDVKNQYYEDSTATTTLQSLSYRAGNIRMVPYVQFDVPVNKNAAIYGKLGYVLGFGKMHFVSEERNTSTKGSFDATYKYERSGGTLQGTTMALGYRFKVGDEVSFFAELNVSALKQKVKQDQMVKAESDGEDILPYIDKYYTTTDYLDELVVSAKPSKPNMDESNKQMAYHAIHSAVGLQLGINFYFAR